MLLRRLESSPTLLELIEPSRWHRLQDHLARVLGVPIRTVDPARELLVPPSWPPHLMNEHAIALLKAGEELEQLIPDDQPPQEYASITTVLGATYTAVPVRATPDAILAYVVIGPIMVGVRENELGFRQRVHAMGLDATALWPVMLSIKLFSFASLRAVLDLVEEMGRLLAETAYQAKGPEGPLPMTTAAAPSAGPAPSMDSLSRALLNAAVFATKADGGSVMLRDPASDTLQIRAAQGLSGTVVSAACVKRGEGIAGLALDERKPFIVDDATPDARVKSRMHRQEVVSSIVAPIVDCTQEPIGVLNLHSTTPGKQFSAEHVQLLQHLIGLAVSRS